MSTALKLISNNPIDALGDIKAEIANLTAIAKIYEAQIKDLGVGAHDGDLFRASVSEVAERSSLCPKAAEEKLRELGVDGRWFSKNQKVAKGYTVLKIVARKA
jgi:hypothetical protein